jgi:hypothetical protein
VRPVVLTSMLKRVDNAVFQEIQGLKADGSGTPRPTRRRSRASS